MKNDLKPEHDRAMRENLDEENLAIYDLLKKPSFTIEEEKEVKKVAKQTLEALKAEKLKIDRWRESTQVRAQVKTMIKENLDWLPQVPYPDEELADINLVVYQHIYTNYQGSGNSTYERFG